MPVALFLFPRSEAETWWVSNILQTEENELTRDQYNAALTSFYEQVIQPAIQNTVITVEILAML